VPATVTVLGSIWNTTAGNKTVTATPAVGDLIVILSAATGLTSSTHPTDDNSSGTYANVVLALQGTSANYLAIEVRTALIPAAVSTIFTMGQTGSSGGGGCVLAIAGPTLAGASSVAHSGGQNNQAAGTPAPSFGAAASAGNACVGAVLTSTNGSANCAPPAGWTEDIDLGYNTPASGIEVCHIASGETGTTITFGAATPSVFAAAIAEFKVPAAELPILVMAPPRS
jgi:hypothetical protein